MEIKSRYDIVLDPSFVRQNIAATEEQAEAITLAGVHTNDSANTVIASGETDLIKQLGKQDDTAISGSLLNVSGLDLWHFEIDTLRIVGSNTVLNANFKLALKIVLTDPLPSDSGDKGLLRITGVVPPVLS